MTCIVAYKQDDTCWIGGDSCGFSSHDYMATPRIDCKVFEKREMLFGFTSSFRMGQIIRYSMSIPQPEATDPMQYMVAEFIPALRSALKDGGYAKIESNQETGGCFIACHRGRIFTVYPDFQVEEVDYNYWSVGCGEKFALGALFVMKNVKPEIAIKRALEAAAEFSGGVCPPFTILSRNYGESA